MARSSRALFRLLPALAGLGALLLSACAHIPLPEREGMALYRRKCSGCHRPYAPVEIKAAKWEKTIAEMRKRAKLTAEDEAAIRRYVEVDLIAHP